jgi:molybdopterin-guanine dinucleotide biosynthesis protein A
VEALQAAPTCCAVILAGGRNTRMQGRNKAFLTIAGRTILDRLLETLQPIFAQILLVTRQPELYTPYPLRVVKDILKARSSLTGIHAGLAHAETEYAFVVPCDAPLLRPDLVRLLLSEIDPSMDALVPMIRGYYEPLCAIYGKQCLVPIEEQLKRADFKITRFFEHIRLKEVDEQKIRAVDPQLHSFLNINTPEAFEALKIMGD